MQLTLMENVTLALAGVFLLFSYYRLGTTTKNVNELWGSIDGNLISLYTISMFICAFGFIALFIYLNSSNKVGPLNKHCLYISLMGIVLFSIFWMPLSIFYLMKKKSKENGLCFIKMLVLFTLFLVALSAFFVVYELQKINDNSMLYNLSYYGMCYFFFHVFVLDLTSWSYNFF